MKTITQLENIIHNTEVEKQNLMAQGMDFFEFCRLNEIIARAEKELEQQLEAEAEKLELINMEFINYYA